MLKGIFTAACIAAGSAVFASSSGDSVLLWMVDMNDDAKDFANNNVSKVGDLTLRGSGTSNDGKHANSARVRVYNGTTAMTDQDGNAVYLNLYLGNELVDGMVDLDLTTLTDYGSDEYSPAHKQGPGSYAGPQWADFGQYATTDYSFAIELGFLGDDDNWFEMAHSEIKGYSALLGHSSSDVVAPPEYGPWSSSYSVPEPTSGLLVLIGGALLALKRRRNVLIGV